MTRLRFRRSLNAANARLILFASAALAGVLLLSHNAADARTGGTRLNAAEADVETARESRLVAYQLAQLAEAVLMQSEATERNGRVAFGRGSAETTRARLGAALQLLEQAVALDPENAWLLRRTIEVATEMGEVSTEAALRVRLLRVEPTDAVNQLLVVLDNLRGLQTAEARLTAIERLVGEGRNSLDPGVRSRLLWEAAVLYRELGRDDLFIAHLDAALKADPTNRDAAALRALYLETQGAPFDRVAGAMLDLIAADPYNRQAALDLAALLLRHRAYASAYQLLRYASDLTAQSGLAMSADSARLMTIAASISEGPSTGLAVLQSFQDNVLTFLARQDRVAKWEASRQEQPDLSFPDLSAIEAPLPVDLEVLRAMLAEFDLQSDLASAARTRALSALAPDEARTDEERDSPQGEASANSDSQLANDLQRLWLLLWLEGAPEDLAEAQRLHDRLVESGRVRPAGLERFAGWMDLRQGDLDAAIRRLTPLAETDPQARAGLALARSLRGDAREAAIEYARLVESRPDDMLGLWAHLRLERVLNRDLPEPSRTITISADVTAAVRTLREVLRDPVRLYSVQLTSADRMFDPFQPMSARFTLRNDAGRPLAIGPDRPLPELLAILPSLQVRGEPLGSDGPVSLDVNLRRRFFLAPGESIDLEIPVTPTRLGRFLESHPDRPIAIVLRSVVDPRRSTTTREVVPGPRGTIRDTPPFARNRLGLSAEQVDAWIAALDSPESQQRYDALAGVAVFLTEAQAASLAARGSTSPGAVAATSGRIASAGGGAQNAAGAATAPSARTPQQAKVADAEQRAVERLSTIWNELDDADRAWFAAIYRPPSPALSARTGPGEADLAGLETMVKRSPGPLTRMVMLVTRVESADDPFLAAALRSDDQLVRDLAAYIAELLKTSATTGVK